MSDQLSAEARYEAVRLDLHKRLEPHLMTRENDIRTRFATKHVARDVLQDENLRRFYQYLSVSGFDGDGSLGIDEDEFVRRVLERGNLSLRY